MKRISNKTIKYLIYFFSAIFMFSCGRKKDTKEDSQEIENINNIVSDFENNDPIRR